METKIMRKIQVMFSENGTRLFRNQVGVYRLADGRALSSGLCPGSSDLIGWHPKLVTQEMVGKTVAIFMAVETKSHGWRENSESAIRQRDFINTVKKDGGIAFFAESIAEALDRFEKEIRGLNE